jgi:uncharacterized protein
LLVPFSRRLRAERTVPRPYALGKSIYFEYASQIVPSSPIRGRCYRCGYVWSPRRSPIKMCARCKSKFWDVPLLRKLPRDTGLGIDEIIGPHRRDLKRLVRQHKAGRVRVFGSVARSAAGPRSDVDLLVDFGPGASVYDQVELIFDLERVLRRKVDVTTEAALHWLIRPQALFEAVAL